jgi:hypothetical protein
MCASLTCSPGGGHGSAAPPRRPSAARAAGPAT